MLISVFTFLTLLIPKAFPQFKGFLMSYFLQAAFSDNASLVCIDIFSLPTLTFHTPFMHK